MHLDKTIRIAAPPETVFEWLAPGRQALWDPSLVRAAPRHEAPNREGSILDRVGRALGHRFESALLTVALEPGRLLAWHQVEGDYEKNDGAYVLEPDGRGTRLRYVADVELPFVLPRLATEAEVQGALSRDADEALFRLKSLIERRGMAA